jgi:tRNA(Ile)-lysidine synthase
MNFSNELGYRCFLLNWDHNNNLSNLQARARDARYQLMTQLANELDISTILTGHHTDDYCENFYIRQERKSSIFGLSSTNIHYVNNIRILRPLFNINKCALIDYLTDQKIQWCEDKSNISDKYQRNRIRKMIKDTSNMKETILLKQNIVNHKINEFKSSLIAAIAHIVKIYEFGFALMNLQKFTELPQEIMIQLINFILTIVGGKTKVPRGSSTNLLLSELIQKSNFTTCTLHGCLIKKISADMLLIYREFGKTIPCNVALNKNSIWDNRFRVKSSINLINAYITNLAIYDYNQIKDSLDLKELAHLTCNNHKAILFTLPIIKIVEKIIALPHISYYNENDEVKNKLDLLFQPLFISRFTHFC